MSELIPAPNKQPPKAIQLGSVSLTVPNLIADEGKPTAKRFIEFFTAHIRNPNRLRASGQGFLRLVR